MQLYLGTYFVFGCCCFVNSGDPKNQSSWPSRVEQWKLWPELGCMSAPQHIRRKLSTSSKLQEQRWGEGKKTRCPSQERGKGCLTARNNR